MKSANIFPIDTWSVKQKYRDILSPELYHFLSKYLNLELSSTKLFDTGSIFNIEKYENFSCSNIINIKKINDLSNICQFIKIVNDKLELYGFYVLCAETLSQRKNRLKNKFSKQVFPIYYFFDFIIKRVFPKWGPTRKINFLLTNGKNRVLSETEILGRLVSCGFEIVKTKEINGLTYFVTKRIRSIEKIPESSHGLLFKMKRMGKDGKSINVYKFRTMHPYAEFLQDYVYKKNHLHDGGKFKNDFRLASWGKFLRKYWLDELPMFYNFFKGELKLIGVRPLSNQYLKLYTTELKEKRIKTKPGLAPPYYADNPTSFEEIMQSEMKYLNAYEKTPYMTDIKYFFKIFFNILFKAARSS